MKLFNQALLSVTLSIALSASFFLQSESPKNDSQDIKQDQAKSPASAPLPLQMTPKEASPRPVLKPALTEAKEETKKNPSSPVQPTTSAACEKPALSNAIQHLETKEDLDKALKTPGPKIFKFHAHWCNPCKMIEKDIAKLALKYYDKIKVYALDSDNPAFAQFARTHSLMSLPTLIFLPSRLETFRRQRST